MLAAALAGILAAFALALPLAWKWGLGVRRVAIALVAIGGLVAAGTAPLGLAGAGEAAAVATSTLAVAFAILAWRFYRDPERRPPGRDDVVVSPADGEVLYVRESRDGVLPVAAKHGRDYQLVELTGTPLRTERAVVIGIGMSFLDVHVNRSPIAGRVRLRRHFPGSFGSLRRPRMVFENERATTVIERPGVEIAVVQIASRLVRRIAGFVENGEDVALGQRIGAIRLGSQVDLVLPEREVLELTVEPGRRIRAGETVLARLHGDPPRGETELSVAGRRQMQPRRLS